MRFLVRQKYFSIRDGFYIKDEAGRDMYYVRGKIISFGKKLTLSNNAGQELLFIKQRLFRIRPRFDCFRGEEEIAVIKRNFFPLFIRKNYTVKTKDFGTLKIKGSVMAWKFSIVNEAGQDMALISKHILNINDTYTVDVYDRRFEVLALGIAIILDAIHHIKH